MPGEGQAGPAAAVHASDWPAYDADGRRVPDFFIVGHQKCGTTALHLMLKDHPQIFLPEVKEPRFFVYTDRTRAPRREEAAKGRPRTLEEYLALFAPAGPGQRAGEASPQYLRSHTAPARIAQLAPRARIIAILREPVDFLRSLHLQLLSSNIETQKDFEKAIALESRRREGKRIPSRCEHPETLLYSEHVRYVEQLRRFAALFGEERMLVLLYDDYRADNEATVRSVLRFLGVDDAVAIEATDTKPSTAVRSRSLHRVARVARRAHRNPHAAGPVSRAIDAVTPDFLRSDSVRARWRHLVYSQPPAPDEEFTRELRLRYRPEVVALSEYLDRDLVSLWGYDRL